MKKRSSGTARDYPRTARLNHLVQEIVAEELERIDDDRLGFLTVVGVEVEADLRRAVVWYTTLDEPGTDDELVELLDEHRPRIQSAINRQTRVKRTPELVFRPDTVIRQAQRVEQILREIGDDDSPGSPEPGPFEPAPSEPARSESARSEPASPGGAPSESAGAPSRAGSSGPAPSGTASPEPPAPAGDSG
jgi:ribosome-binding factor A